MRAHINATKLGKDVKRKLSTLQRKYSSLVPPPDRCFHPVLHTRTYSKRASTTFQATPVVRHERNPEIHIPRNANLKDPGFWAAAIDSLLPPELCRDRENNIHTEYDAIPYQRKLLRLIINARKQSNIDILADLAIKQRRWDAFLWICSFLIASLKPEKRSIIPRDGFTDIAWPSDVSLSKLSEAPFVLPQKEPGPNAELLSLKQMSGPQILDPLQHINASDHAVLGQIWRSLGHILLESSRREDELKSMISKALLVIAHLHHAGFIPDQAHQFTPNWDPLALVQPPLINSFSHDIIQSLSDAMYVYQQVEDDESFDINASNEDLGHASRLGPEIWLEFILWCCVHGGWVMDGASIVQAMGKMPAPWKWSLKSDRKLIPSASQTSFLIPERTIGPEAVAAVVNGLIIKSAQSDGNLLNNGLTINSAQNTGNVFVNSSTVKSAQSAGEATFYHPHDFYRQLSLLKNTLSSKRMNLGSFTWNSLIVRLFESPSWDISLEPEVARRYFLPLSESLKQLRTSLNSPLDPNVRPWIRDHVYQPSAAIIGLYHQTISAHIKAKDIRGALQTLASLQKFTDTNKVESVNEFFKQLTSTALDATQSDLSQRGIQEADLSSGHAQSSTMPNLRTPGYLPEIPVAILAALLDLITVSGETEAGKWMIYSTDADGPLIPEELYADQTIAASLIRFATSCLDRKLLARIQQSQSTTISGDTLIVLACSRIRESRLDAAAEILGIIQSFTPEYWNARAFASLVGALISHGDESLAQDEKRHTALYQFTKKLLHGELNIVSGVGTLHYNSIVAIAASCRLPTDNFFIRELVRGSSNVLEIDHADFQTILNCAMEAGGSLIGRLLWTRWCSKELGRATRVRADREQGEDQRSVVQKLELFSRQKPKPRRVWPYATFTRSVKPEPSTARLIIHKATRELREDGPNSSSNAREVLYWAIQEFGEQFVDDALRVDDNTTNESEEDFLYD